MPDLNPTDLAGKPVAWIDNSGHPHHLSYVQGVREKQLYGPLRPLYDQAALDAKDAEIATLRAEVARLKEHAVVLAETARQVERERCALVCDVTPPYPFRPSIEAAHAIRTFKDAP